MTIYIVTSGSYSDYRINAVFLDRKKAEAYCAAINTQDFQDAGIEEFEEGPAADQISWIVHLYTYASEPQPSWSAHLCIWPKDPRHNVVDHTHLHDRDHWQVVVHADSREAALKIGMEKIQQFRAMQGVEHA